MKLLNSFQLVLLVLKSVENRSLYIELGYEIIISFTRTCIKIHTFQLVKKEKIHAFKNWLR